MMRPWCSERATVTREQIRGPAAMRAAILCSSRGTALHFANRLRAYACYQRDMRSVWSTLVAVTLVVASTRVGAAPAGHPGHRELHAAMFLRVAPTVRRAHQPVRPRGARGAGAAGE